MSHGWLVGTLSSKVFEGFGFFPTSVGIGPYIFNEQTLIIVERTKDVTRNGNFNYRIGYTIRCCYLSLCLVAFTAK